LEEDPRQAENVAGENPKVVKELHAEFVKLLETCPVSDEHKELRISL
jgi:hypothetical protein